MAPLKSARRRQASYEKEQALWNACSRAESVPESFTCYDLAERHFGVTFKVNLNKGRCHYKKIPNFNLGILKTQGGRGGGGFPLHIN